MGEEEKTEVVVDCRRCVWEVLCGQRRAMGHLIPDWCRSFIVGQALAVAGGDSKIS